MGQKIHEEFHVKGTANSQSDSFQLLMKKLKTWTDFSQEAMACQRMEDKPESQAGSGIVEPRRGKASQK